MIPAKVIRYCEAVGWKNRPLSGQERPLSRFRQLYKSNSYPYEASDTNLVFYFLPTE